MYKRVLVICALVVLLFAAIGSVGAITNGQVDTGNEYSYVGLIVFDVDGAPSHRCTGTLLTSRVVLTAGHCTVGTSAARVWFDVDVQSNTEYPFSGATSYDGVAYTYNYTGIIPNTGDVGVVVLSEPVDTSVTGVAALPPVGFLDSFATQRGQQDRLFTVVGYGRQQIRPNLQAVRIRYWGTTQLTNLRSALTDGFNVQFSNNNGQGHSGGTCFGDSGGPTFYGAFGRANNVVVAVTSFGLNSNCVGTDFSYRVDTADVQSWINGYVVANP